MSKRIGNVSASDWRKHSLLWQPTRLKRIGSVTDPYRIRICWFVFDLFIYLMRIPMRKSIIWVCTYANILIYMYITVISNKYYIIIYLIWLTCITVFDVPCNNIFSKLIRIKGNTEASRSDSSAKIRVVRASRLTCWKVYQQGKNV